MITIPKIEKNKAAGPQTIPMSCDEFSHLGGLIINFIYFGTYEGDKNCITYGKQEYLLCSG